MREPACPKQGNAQMWSVTDSTTSNDVKFSVPNGEFQNSQDTCTRGNNVDMLQMKVLQEQRCASNSSAHAVSRAFF